jgi:hypothetical protein
MSTPKVYDITAYPAKLDNGFVATFITRPLQTKTYTVNTLEELLALRKDLGDAQAALGNPNVVGIRQLAGIAFRGQKLALSNPQTYFNHKLRSEVVSPVNRQTLSPAANRALSNCAW